MTATAEITFGFAVDPANPGQFFACCGLLELADRKWPGVTTGSFEPHGRVFRVRVDRADPGDLRAQLVNALVSCPIGNLMTAEQQSRLDELSKLSKKAIQQANLEDEKKRLESLRRESPVTLGSPFHLTIDWHQDERGRGANFKTWAGQQSIIDIASGMQEALRTVTAGTDLGDAFLSASSRGAGLPFNFDADLGAQGAALDVGFSFDPLPGLSIGVRPALELCAFVGLQRFRPAQIERENRYRYATWAAPLPPSIASAAACGRLDSLTSQTFEFRLLYRTKYLKSFLASKPVRGES